MQQIASLKVDNEGLKIERDNFKDQNTSLINEKKAVKNENLELGIQNKSLLEKIVDLEKELSKLKLKLSVKKTLSDNQLASDSSNKRVNWSEEEYSKAFSIRYLSKKCYIHLRQNLYYPLPSLSALKLKASKMVIVRGINDQLLHFLSIIGSSLSPQQKLTTLAFYDMKIEKTYEYDFNSQCVLRPTNQMTVIYACGVIEKWKQPIYVDFDKPVTKKILFDIVKKFCDIDFQVVALVSDCHPSNRGLWRSCGVDINHLNKPYFTTPFSDQKIFIFPDAPHVLKLIRNWFLDTGYLWDGIKITHFPIEELTQARGDLFSLFKICNIPKVTQICIN